MDSIVIDTNVFISAGWSAHSHARKVFAAVARRRFRLTVSAEILAEYKDVSQRPQFAGKNYSGLMSWIQRYAVVVSGTPLGKQHSRDIADDIFLACALGAGAKTIVSDDQDLLCLRKPFGVSIVSAAEFIATYGL